MTMPRVLPPAGVPLRASDIFSGCLAGMRAALSSRAASQYMERFRRGVRSLSGCTHVFGYSSGRGAMSHGLRALHSLCPERDEVLIPAYTSYSVPSAVVHAGFKVALYDLDPETLSPCTESLAAAITERTLCIVVCHMYGVPADMAAVRTIAEQHGIPVFDDAAQAMGATYNGEQAGAMGLLGLYSMSRGKSISAVDGGILVTNDDTVAAALAAQPVAAPSLRHRLKLLVLAVALSMLLHPARYWIPASLPWLRLGESRFDPQFSVTALSVFQAVLGIRMLARLDSLNAGRRQVAALWQKHCARLARIRPVDGANPTWLRLPVLREDGATGTATLGASGVAGGYPQSLDVLEGIASYRIKGQACPGAAALARRLMTLPTHAYVREADVAATARMICADHATEHAVELGNRTPQRGMA